MRIEAIETRSLLAASVASIGTATNFSVSNANVAVTASASVPVNNTVIVEIAADPTAGAVTVTDARGNVYMQDANVINSGHVEIWVFSAPVASGLSAGDQVVAHFAGAPSRAKAVSVLSVGGLVLTNKLDLTHGATGSSVAPNSGATTTTRHPQELLIGAIGVEGPSGDGFTAGTGYTLIGRAGTTQESATTNVTINPEFRTVSSTGQYMANGVISPIRSWGAVIATYVVASAPVIVQPANQTNTEGDAVNLQIVASDSDGDPLTYSATGLPPGLSINASTGLITGNVQNTFANHGPYSVSVTAADPSGLSDTKNFTWSVVNVAPTAIGHSYDADENTPLSLPAPGVLAGSSDPGGESLTAVLDSGVSHGTLTLNSNGSFTYTPTAGYTGTDAFTYHAYDGAVGGNIATVDLDIGETTPPIVTPTGNQTNNENDSVNVQVVAVDPGGESLLYTAAGLPDGLSINANTGLIGGTIAGAAADHAPFNVDVSVIDGPLTVHDLFTWTVNNVAPLVAANDLTLTEGISSGLITVATFTDVGGPEPIGNYSAAIDWGDGSSASAGTVSLASGTFTVQGSHTYAEESTSEHTPGGLDYYVVKATVVDNNGFSTLSSTATSHATVSDPAVTPTGGYTFTAIEGELSALQTVATFTDPGGPEPVGDYSADINWGDGGANSSGTITFNAGTGIFTVQGSHLYADENSPGIPYIITTTIRHEHAPDAVAVSLAVVSEGPIAANGVAVNGFEFSPLANVPVATFTHGISLEPPEEFQATINWGDGATSAGIVSVAAHVYTVTGSHTYTDEASFPISVVILDIDPGSTASATANSTATMLEELLPDGSRGTPNQRFISEVYRDLLGRQVDLPGLAAWDAALAFGQSRQQIVQGIEHTPEYAVDVVQSLYERYLHRSADPVGLQQFVIQFLNGATVEQISALMSGSNEFFVTQGGGTNSGFLNAVYEDALGRAIDSNGLAWWSSLLALGVGRTQVAAQILATQEYRQDVVKEAYLQLLDRPADPVGLNGWVAYLNAGFTDQFVYSGICASPEFYNKTLP